MPIGIRGIEKTLERGDTVFIAGQGPAGLLCTQITKAYGASKVIVSHTHSQRLELAKNLGADYGINTRQENVVDRAREILKDGSDVAIECVGVEETFRDCESIVKSGSSICIFGTHMKPLNIDLHKWEGRSLSLVMAREQPEETPDLMRKTIELLRTKAVKTKPLVSHIFPLERVGKAFEMLKEKRKDVIKIVIMPNRTG